MSDKIEVGKVIGAFGIKGEIKVYAYGDSPDKFASFSMLQLSKSGLFDVEQSRAHKGLPIIKLRGVDDRDKAESMRGEMVYVEESALKDLPDDTFYVKDLIGLDVLDFSTGLKIGNLRDVTQGAAQDTYVIDTKNGDVLVPAVAEFIKKVDIENKTIEISFIEGML